MPDEPNKEMDETLRAYAQERRKAPEVSLHPATRNLLQGEVKRVFGSSQAALPWWRKLRAFWPHFAFAGGLCLVFGIAVLSLRQPSRTLEEGRTESGATPQTAGKDMSVSPSDLPKELKKQEKPAEAQGAGILNDSLQPAREAPPAEVAQSSDFKRKTVAEPKLNERVPLQNARPTSARTSVGREREENRAAEEEELLSRSAPANTAAAPATRESDVAVQLGTKTPDPAVAPKSIQPAERQTVRSVRDDKTASSAQVRARGAAIAEPLGRAEQLNNLSAARRLSFVQLSNPPVVVGAPVTAVPSTVLTSFQMEQSGTNLRVLDRDGSIYLGTLQATNGATIAGLKVNQAQTENSLAYFFQVQGTNRTLNSDVVLTGNYFEQTNPAPSSVELFAITPEAAKGQQSEARQQSQARHYIIGNATVGSTNHVPVHAISTLP
jgi:hypothetical protein